MIFFSVQSGGVLYERIFVCLQHKYSNEQLFDPREQAAADLLGFQRQVRNNWEEGIVI